MATALGIIILVGGFVFLFKGFSLPATAGEVFAATQQALGVMQDPGRSDDEKEREMRGLARQLFGCFLVLTLGSAAALGIPAGIVWGLDFLGVLSFQTVVDVTLSWEFLLGTTLVLVLVGVFKNSSKGDGYEIRYSMGERALYQVAFSTTLAQLSVADMEDALFAKRIAGAQNNRPVFITGLPRGGTTLVLNLLYSLDEFASHRYRDMPFLLTPLLWQKFSAMFQKSDELRERAHGDGMMVSADSPEALEEMIWKAFWPKQYRKDRIASWPMTADAAFNEFFQNHMAKIIALKPHKGTACRYVSKNNLNISRIDYLRTSYPDAVVIIPFRHPVHHARSLCRQHHNFLEIHARDTFARTYMEGVGHYDFGQSLRPVNFDGWLDNRRFTDPEDINFWLEYWIAAYTYLLARTGGNVFLHSYEALCDNPSTILDRLADLVGITDKEGLLGQRETIQGSQWREFPTDDIDPELLRRSEELWERLRNSAYTA